jgi:N-acetylmuramoyl-L-alanine amidase
MATTALWNYGQEITFTAPARKVDSAWLHCSASDHADHNDVAVIRGWHVNDNKWADVGYHFFITKQGAIQPGRPLEKTPAAQEGLNTGAIAMCVHGLVEGKFTTEQFESVIKLCTAIKDAYGEPIRFRGHREVAAKTCPVFNYVHVLGLNTSGYMGGGTNSSPPTANAPPPSGPGATKPPANGLRVTDRGVPVSVMQNLLIMNGFSCTADGIFGKETERKLRDFQRAFGTNASGVADTMTQNALAKGLARVRDLKTGLTGDDVRAFQRIMGLHQIACGVDGAFGALTLASVQSFQRKYGIQASGVVDQETRLASWSK